MGDTWSDFQDWASPPQPSLERRQQMMEKSIEKKMTAAQAKYDRLERIKKQIQNELDAGARAHKKKTQLLPLARSIRILELAQNTVMKSKTDLLSLNVMTLGAQGMYEVGEEMAKVGQMLTAMNGVVSIPRLTAIIQQTTKQQHLMGLKADLLQESIQDMHSEGIDELDDDETEKAESKGDAAMKLVDQAFERALMEVPNVPNLLSMDIGTGAATRAAVATPQKGLLQVPLPQHAAAAIPTGQQQQHRP